MNIVKEFQKFCDNEFEDAKKAIESCRWTTPREIVHNSMDRCLGSAFFAQQLGASFEEIDVIYTEVKENLRSLLTD